MPATTAPTSKLLPFRRAVLRGLAILMPPLLTIVVFLWMWNMIDVYVMQPVEGIVEDVIVWSIKDVRAQIPADVSKELIHYDERGQISSFRYRGTIYLPVRGKWLPDYVKDTVDRYPGEHRYEPTSAKNYFKEYVRIRYLRRELTIPVFLMVFILFLYLLGKMMAAGVGSIVFGTFERLIDRLPIIRTVYSAAKQVTEFVFKEQEVQFTRVVAVQYPRKGVWSMGFVTGEGFLDIRSAANEPVVSVLMPTSPMPATGFTITVPKSETIDLDITIDQAIQYCVSCGVVVPPHQQYSNEEIARRMKAAVDQHDGRPPASQETAASSTGPSAGGQ